MQANKIALYGAQALTVLVIACVLYTDLGMPHLVQSSDYLTCMYTGAKLYATGRSSEMYAPYGATKFAGMPCDIAAHEFLPNMPKTMVGNYNYSPLVAWLISPLTFLPPNLSLLGWQIISLLALAASGLLLTRDENQRKWFMWCCLIFLPTTFTWWIGQFGIVFGLLPIAAGYRLLLTKREIPAGIAFSFALLKPQFVVVPALLIFVFLLLKRWRVCAGFIIGALVLLGMNLLVGGVELFKHWLWMLRLSEIVFTDPTSGLPHHLLISLSGSILLNLPLETGRQMKLVIYGFSACLGLLATAAALLKFRAEKDRERLIRYTLMIGILLMPFLIPHLMYYDLTVVMAIWMFAMDRQLQDELRLPLVKAVIGLSLLINCYAILFLTNKHFASPMILLLAFAVLLGSLMFRGFTKRATEAH